jgi:predicted metal-binding membrane protein
MDRDRRIVLAALVGIVALAWGYLAYIVLRQPAMDMGANAMAMMPARPWDAGYYLATLAMWMVMMVGMMVPSAAPTILLFDALQRQIEAGHRINHRPTMLFAAGYGIAWSAFSIAATTAQWGLSTAMLLSPMMAITSSVFAGLLLVAAGAYQFTPWKSACLQHCRSPAEFLVKHRRTGRLGPLMMGLRHGVYCIGCCWALMALLFMFGVMNLLWAAVLAIFVLVEKLAPAGVLLGRIGAALMVCAGVALIAFG